MSSFDALLGRILDNGEEVELRGGLNFIGVTISQNETLNCLNVTFTGVEAGGDNRVAFSDGGALSFNEFFTYDPNDGAGVLSIPAGAFYESNGIAIASVLATDVYLAGTPAGGQATLRLRPGGSAGRVGFYGATPVVKPTITGTRSGNAALGNLLTELANLGLITNSTTP